MRTLFLSAACLTTLAAGGRWWSTRGLVAAAAPQDSGQGAGAEAMATIRTADDLPGPVIAPYLLDLTADSATICWVTREPLASKLELFSMAGRIQEHSEDEPRRFHKVKLEGLEPGQDYSYHVGPVYQGTFRTMRGDQPLRFAVFGHPGGTEVDNKYATELLASRIDDLDPDFALCTGDICYFTSHLSFAQLFFKRFARFLARKPIYVAPGNHEAGFPLAYGHSFQRFRDVFPHDYPSPGDPYYSFVRGNAKFVALAYTAGSREAFQEQLSWMRAELDASESEFNIVFLGGAQDPVYFDRKALMGALEESRVDIVFAGDGSGSFQGEPQGVRYFFAGTNGSKPHDWYDVEILPYEMRIRHYDASTTRIIKSWTFKTALPKRVVAELTDAARSDPAQPAWLYYRNLNAPSSTFSGVRIVTLNSMERRIPIYLRWAPTDATRRGANRYFREQPMWMPPGEVATFNVPLPAINPMTGEPWVLADLHLRASEKYLPEGYSLKQDVIEFSLIADR